MTSTVSILSAFNTVNPGNTVNPVTKATAVRRVGLRLWKECDKSKRWDLEDLKTNY
jgi:hypothetical protein